MSSLCALAAKSTFVIVDMQWLHKMGPDQFTKEWDTSPDKIIYY